jgi:glyoxylase-like metal-dependent hydrolase (beta-lactamase superfamily II)/rhodanese-related sulfurtransferase
MIIHQIYTECLSESAYYIESKDEVAIIDPIRDVEIYLEMARKNNCQIKYIFETHFHADFVSGHVELAKKTGATIIYGPNAYPNFDYYSSKDLEIFSIGDISIQALHTPGHTLESTCFLLKNNENKDHCIFTGDTLFVGDVGRPDLAVKSEDLSKEDLASMLYDSIQSKIIPLSDEVIVYPAHGAGSACGKNIGSETFSTIGEQKAQNYALQSVSKSQFIKEVTSGLLAPPKYFYTDVMMNKNGYDSLNTVIERNKVPLNLEQLLSYQFDGALVLDVRPAKEFAKGFLKGSINIGLDGQFGPWVGAIIDSDRPLIVVCDSSKLDEAFTRLARVGYENVIGYLSINSLPTNLEIISDMSVDMSAKLIEQGNHLVLDVRRPGELESGHVLNAKHIRLQELESRLDELDKNTNIIVYCEGGYRSMISCSILKKNGFEKIINISEGYSKLKHEKVIKLSENACKA